MAKSSAGRAKLESLGIQLPLLPCAPAGNLPKPAELIELRYKVSKGVQKTAELERKERLSTELWLRQQERIGLDVLVEGAMDRSDMVSHFAARLDGFEAGSLVRIYGNRYYRKPVIRNRIQWKTPVTVESWRVAQRMSHRPVKAIVTGPYTLADWSFDEHYRDREQMCRDAAAAVRQEVAALVDAGAKLIQIDELALSARPEEFSLVADGLREITRGLRAYFILRHAYGDLRPIWARMQSLSVDQFALEMANSGFRFLPVIRKEPTEKDVAIGLVDSHSHIIESARVLAPRLRAALAAVPAPALWLTSDSGLKTRTADEASGKLKALVQAAQARRRPRR